MGASEAIVFEKFSVKHSWKRPEATCGMRSCGLSHNSMTSVSDGGKKLDLEYLKEKSSVPRSRKREAPKLMEYQRVKRQRIDHSLSSQSSTILKLQTTHPAGWVSNQPVLVSHMNNADPDSNGAASGLDNENTCLGSQHTAPATDVATLQGCPVYDVHPSPKKALRAAMMKSRFSETILKAQKKTLFDHGNKVDPLKMQREKKRFESIQLQEMTKIKAQMKAAEVYEVEAELKQQRRIEREKQQRESEREAFRVTLQKMTKTVDLEDNLWAQKEFDMLIGSSCSYFWPRAAH